MKSLKKRLSEHQQVKRTGKIVARRTAQEEQAQAQAQLRADLARSQQILVAAVSQELYRRTWKGRVAYAKAWVQRLFKRKAA